MAETEIEKSFKVALRNCVRKHLGAAKNEVNSWTSTLTKEEKQTIAPIVLNVMREAAIEFFAEVEEKITQRK